MAKTLTYCDKVLRQGLSVPYPDLFVIPVEHHLALNLHHSFAHEY